MRIATPGSTRDSWVARRTACRRLCHRRHRRSHCSLTSWICRTRTCHRRRVVRKHGRRAFPGSSDRARTSTHGRIAGVPVRCRLHVLAHVRARRSDAPRSRRRGPCSGWHSFGNGSAGNRVSSRGVLRDWNCAADSSNRTDDHPEDDDLVGEPHRRLVHMLTRCPELPPAGDELASLPFRPVPEAEARPSRSSRTMCPPAALSLDDDLKRSPPALHRSDRSDDRERCGA